MNPDKFEEILFGREEPSGVLNTRGILEQVHGGTLLPDEVTDMSLVTQGKFLRILQEQTFTRINGTVPVAVDVHVLATTHLDIPKLIQKGSFREDVYYRLNVMTICVPPLRSRRQDIVQLLDYLMERVAGALGVTPRTFSMEDLVAFQRYIWPGNVRELRNLIERILILFPKDEEGLESDSSSIRLEQLLSEIIGLTSPLPEGYGVTDILTLPLKQARELFESRYLLAQVARFGGNISKTAHFIGMERAALHRKLRYLRV